MVQLAQAQGLDMLHVPFQGGGPATTALLSGQVQCMSTTPSAALPHVKDGRMRPLAVWGRSRLAGFEDVPSFIERGFGEIEFYIWVGLFAPAGTPAAVLETIRTACRSVVDDADFRRAMAAAGNTVDYREGEAFQRFYDEDTARGVRIVRSLGRIE